MSENKKEKVKKLPFIRDDKLRDALKNIVVLLTICACSALLVSVVHVITSDKMADSTQSEMKTAMLEMFPTSSEMVMLDGTYEGQVLALYRIMQGDAVLGHCVNVGPNGYSGTINMAVGIDADGAVLGIKIISHSETPRLGDRIENPEHLSQYTGKSGELKADKDIDMISGATASSKAVLNGVNAALSAIAAGEGEGN